MKKLSTADEIGSFVETYRNPNKTTEPGTQFLNNLDLIKEFEESECEETCLKGYIVKQKNETIFTNQIPKTSCEDYLTMQLVKESFAASKRDYTEVSNLIIKLVDFCEDFCRKRTICTFCWADQSR